MPNHDIHVVYMSNDIKSHTKLEFRNCIFSNNFLILILIISVIYGSEFTKFGTHAVAGHFEGTVSQNLYLGPSFNFMKSRKLRGKKW